MNKSIAETRFLKDIRLTDNEHIVWQGGAEKAGIAIELLRGVLSLVVLVVFFSVFFNIDELLFVDNPEYRAEQQQPDQVQSGKAETAGSESAETKGEQTASKRHEDVPAKLPNTPLMWLLGIGAALLIAGGGAVAAWLKIRNYWFVVTSERVCIQSGIINIQVVTIDLDKIVSVLVTHSLWDRLFNTHAIEVIHPGGKPVQPNNISLFNPYRIQYVSNSEQLPTELLSHWLPRDNGGRG